MLTPDDDTKNEANLVRSSGIFMKGNKYITYLLVSKDAHYLKSIPDGFHFNWDI